MKIFFPVASVLLISFSLGCGDGPPDPTSSEVLRKAPAMAFGTTCTKVDDDSYGTSSSHKEEKMCMAQYDCADIDGNSATAYGGGATYNGSTYYKNVQWFEGTCDDPQPVTCDERPAADDCQACQYAYCCGPVAVCEDDPNCMAINDCVIACKDDAPCVQRCVFNGDEKASRNIRTAAACANNYCAKECGN